VDITGAMKIVATNRANRIAFLMATASADTTGR
jgi:hypothetical protein